MGMADHECTFLALPDDILAHIFTFLSPMEVMALLAVSQRIRRVVCFPEVIRYTSFHFTHPPGLFASFLDAVRACAIVELDLNNCLQLGAATIERCLRFCVNLKTLRCINTKILPENLLALTANELKNLTCLEWSLLSKQFRHAATILQQLRQRKLTFGLQRLKHMYVEVYTDRAIGHLLVYVLQHCPEITSVHVHEHDARLRCPGLSHLVMDAYARLENWKEFTYTTERVASTHAMTFCMPRLPSPVRKSVAERCRTNVAKYRNASMSKEPPLRNCAELNDSCIIPTSEGLMQLLLCLETPLSWTLLREMARRKNRDLRELRALTLATALWPHHAPRAAITCADVRLAEFMAACSGLRELNLASFHAGEFDCCEVLSRAVIPHLRSLSLPACAVSRKTSIPQLANASFRLRVLDVRGQRPICEHFCARCVRIPTCTSECLASLHKLCPLERLTLCELPHVRKLDFLMNCSVLDLRIRSTGPMEDLSPLLRLCPKLRSLALHGKHTSETALWFLNDLQPTQSMRRVCISLHEMRDQRVNLLPLLQRLFPNANTLHLHTQWKGRSRFNQIWTRLPNDDCASVLPNDNLELCNICDYTGLQKPFLGQYKYANL
ncbi:hypothetical protein HPB52_005474 [Rhipicephalus sanguineus]|uniref:F-box domain-containing protein n=1 Tax=Rhipicephalus sanguineus TaxID=34632 RepID=A0A9D4T8M1_RHISA|nr:hypothetical protein HPB52_005474 [Rhipicephalus sanguineus]